MCICSYHSWKYNITYLKGYRKKKEKQEEDWDKYDDY